MSSGPGQVVSWYVCTAVSLGFLGTRLIVKWRKFGRLNIEDYFLSLAAVCLVGDLGIQHYMFNQGMNDIGNANRAGFIHIFQMIVPGSILYVTSLWAIKAALVLFYKRIADRTSLQRLYGVALGVLGVTWAVIFFDIIFLCYPIDRKWSEDPTRSCSKKASEINYWLTVLLNISSDVVIMILPISMVMGLHMPLKQKLGVAAMFALGLFVVIASIIRAYYSRINNTMLTCTVSMIETSVALITACLPVLRQVILGKMLSRKSTTSQGKHYELSTRHRQSNRGTPALPSTVDTYIVGGTRKQSDSEDELVKDAGHSSIASGNGNGDENQPGIAVTTEYEVFAEDRGQDTGRRNIVKF